MEMGVEAAEAPAVAATAAGMLRLERRGVDADTVAGAAVTFEVGGGWVQGEVSGAGPEVRAGNASPEQAGRSVRDRLAWGWGLAGGAEPRCTAAAP